MDLKQKYFKNTVVFALAFLILLLCGCTAGDGNEPPPYQTVKYYIVAIAKC